MNSFWHIIKHHVRNGHLRAVGVEMLVGAFMMLIAGMILMGASISALHDIGLSARTSQITLQYVAEVDSGILGCELSMRGYAMTGDPYYLKRYNTRVQDLRNATFMLKQSLASEPGEAARLKLVSSFVDRRLKLFSRLLRAGPSGRNVLSSTIVRPDLRAERISIRNSLLEMRSNARQRLEMRQHQAEQEIQQSYILSSVIVFLAFALTVLGLLLMGGGQYFWPQMKQSLIRKSKI